MSVVEDTPGITPETGAPLLEIELLGGMTVRVAGTPLPRLRSRQGYRLLALLALRHGRAVERSFLAASLWPDNDEASALALLRRSLTDLRTALGPAGERLLSPTRNTLQLNLTATDRLDVAAFEPAALSANPQERDRAIALYRGPLLDGYNEDWAVLERLRLEAVYESALERRKEASPSLPAPPPTGREAAPTISAERQTATLPLLPTRFIGRTAEQESLIALLTSEDAGGCVVTITGTGGTGKTRLAVETAHRLANLSHFAGGAIFVPLGDLTTPDLASQALARALGVPLGGNPALIERIAAYLSSGPPRLLLLDNCEHLLTRRDDKGDVETSIAAFIRDLRERLPASIALLATSRVPLHIPGERRFALSPLPLAEEKEGAGADSIVLFRDRAGLGGEADADVSAICRMLDGLPLAIELAASWSSLLSPHQIRQRLEKQRDVLVARRGASAERHNSLHTVLKWSYDLLSAEQQFVFRCLGVFPGSWNIDAVEALCAAVAPIAGIEAPSILRTFAELQDRSLIVIVCETDAPAGTRGVETRYRLLETVRAFAQEMLSTEPELRQAVYETHAAYFADLAARSSPDLRGEKQAEALLRLDREGSNLRAALDWYQNSAAGSAAEHALTLCLDLARYWEARGGLVEWSERIASALEKPGAGAPTLLRARVLASAGTVAWMRADYPTARRSLEEAREIARVHQDNSLLANLLSSLANVTYYEGDRPAALRLYEESLALARQIDDPARIALALGNLGVFAEQQGDYAHAITLFEEQLAIRRRLGEPSRIAITLGNLATSLNSVGQNEAAEAAFAEAESIYRALGFRTHLSYVLRMRAIIAREAGDLERARPRLREAARLEYEGDLKFDLMETLGEWIWLEAITPGREESAACLIGAVEASDLPRESRETSLRDSYRRCVEVRGETAAQAALYRGRLLTLADVMERIKE